MNADVIRLFEHIKLLQRGVELCQKEKGAKLDDLPNGLNGQKVRIGLLGATSAGKTTLIRRLLSESAGKISSRPETACLVVHSCAKSESLTFYFNQRVRFDDENVGREFTQFLKDYKLSDNYDKKSVREWLLKKDIVEDSREYSRENIFSFFEQVNKFGEVFSKIIWHHKQRGSDYSLTDLIDIYDLPGFGGKEEHDKSVSEIFQRERFDVLIYLIDTSCGIPSAEEMQHLHEVQGYFENNPMTMFYWAYEKPSPEKIDFAEMHRQINESVSQSHLRLEIIDKGLLDLTGADVGEDEQLRSTVLTDILKPYYIAIGKDYRDRAYDEAGVDCGERESLYQNVFAENDGWPFLKGIFDDIEAEEKENQNKGIGLTKEDVRAMIVKVMTGVDKDGFHDLGEPSVSQRTKQLFRRLKGFIPRKQMPSEMEALDSSCEKSESDRDIAIHNALRRIVASVDEVLSAIFNLDRLSLTKMAAFKCEVYNQNPDVRMLGYEIQFYWMLKDPKGVVGFIKKPMADSLRDNVDREVKAIEDFETEDD